MVRYYTASEINSLPNLDYKWKSLTEARKNLYDASKTWAKPSLRIYSVDVTMSEKPKSVLGFRGRVEGRIWWDKKTNKVYYGNGTGEYIVNKDGTLGRRYV